MGIPIPIILYDRGISLMFADNIERNTEYKAENAVDGSKYAKGIIWLIVLTAVTLIQPSMLPLSVSGTVSAQLLIAVIKAAIIIGTYMHFSAVPAYLKNFIYTVVGMIVYMFIMVNMDNQNRDLSALTAPKATTQQHAPAHH